MEERIKDFEIESFYQVLQETGIKGIMERSDVLMLNHLVERGFLPHHREGIILGLRENTEMSFNDILELYNRWLNLKEGLPSYSLKLNQRMDQISKMYGEDFTWVGNRLLGLVKEGDVFVIYDGNGNNLIKLGEVDSDWSIKWNSNWLLQPEHLRWGVKKVRETKKRLWNEFK